jgi:hypothetical protein
MYYRNQLINYKHREGRGFALVLHRGLQIRMGKNETFLDAPEKQLNIASLAPSTSLTVLVTKWLTAAI